MYFSCSIFFFLPLYYYYHFSFLVKQILLRRTPRLSIFRKVPYTKAKWRNAFVAIVLSKKHSSRNHNCILKTLSIITVHLTRLHVFYVWVLMNWWKYNPTRKTSQYQYAVYPGTDVVNCLQHTAHYFEDAFGTLCTWYRCIYTLMYY